MSGLKSENAAVEENRLESRRRKNLYEEHLQQIDEELGRDGTEVKMDVMYSMF
jgi:hypothetical protein